MLRTDDDLYGWQCRFVQKVKEAVARVYDKGVMVFVDAGQGKTVPSLTAIVDLLDDMMMDKCIVVAPIKICEGVWRQEAKKWDHTRDVRFSLVRGTAGERAFALNRPANVYLINFEHLQWLKRHLRGNFRKFPLIFIDESSLIANPKSKRFKALEDIKDNHMETVTFVVMTGTPLPKSILDIWTQAYLVDGGERLGADNDTFKYRFTKVGKRLTKDRFEVLPADFAFDEIKKLVSDITLELGDEEKKKFPVVEVPHWIDLPPRVREQYDQLEQDMIFEWENEEIIPKHGGARSIMCRQIASGAIYKNRLLSEDFTTLHDEKLDLLSDLLEQLNRPCIIAYEFRHDLARLKKLLGGDYLVLNETDGRTAEKAWNSGKINNLLMHNNSSVFGLNLQFAQNGHTIIRFSETWSQDKHDQLRARLARNGQEAEQVFDHYIRARDTVEHMMEISRTIKGDEQTRWRTALRRYQRERGIA